MRPQRVEVLGVPVDCVTMRQALAAVEAMLAGDRPETVIAVNPEKVMKARRDPALLNQLMRAGLLIPDGIGVVVAARGKSLERVERVAGADLMPMICDLAARRGHPVFLFGATPEANRLAVETLRGHYPDIRIVGAQHGYLTDDEMPEVIRQINESQAEVLFIALGSPAQEIWMDRYLPQVNVKVCQGVGGTFDVLAGRVKRAPWLVRRVHLEWLYRLLVEPRRIARQAALPKFALQIANRMTME